MIFVYLFYYCEEYCNQNDNFGHKKLHNSVYFYPGMEHTLLDYVTFYPLSNTIVAWYRHSLGSGEREGETCTPLLPLQGA